MIRSDMQENSSEVGTGAVTARTSLLPTLQLAGIFAAATFLLHFAINLRAQAAGYGLFRDELYYIVCGRHLAWGYVDQPPFVALAARVSELLFGWHSLALFRIFPSLAGALEVAGTGLLVREMGGRRLAQILAMTCMMVCPVTLGLDAILSMNAFEPIFWLGTAYSVLRALRGDDKRWWLVAGSFAGIGLENKWNEAFFLIAIAAALALLPTRKLLDRWFAACVALIVLLSLPNLLWQAHRSWPTLVWLHNAAAQGKNFVYSPLAFVFNQIVITGPISSVLWIGGLVWLIMDRDRRGLRWVGVLYLLYLPAMIALHASDYYLAPVYPLLFAAGGAAWEHWLQARRATRFLVPAFLTLVALYGLGGILSVQPVLTPPEYLHLLAGSAVRPRDPGTFEKSPLPELMADMTGWREIADKLAEVYLSLSPEDQQRAGILAENYGEASAVNVYRPDVPIAISAHQNYWYWGPRGHDGSVMVVFGGSRKALEKRYGSVVVAAHTTNLWGQPFEATSIYVCRKPVESLSAMWPGLKIWM